MLLLRETPLYAGYIDLVARATASAATIMSPLPAFYHNPSSILDIVDQTIGRALDLFDVGFAGTKRWKGEDASPAWRIDKNTDG
ncbi:hypothetical protein [Neorhizobium petrolearium]|uniref:hypothetical protein n=1 Tax=Neorhizobium petrolearium TaxID=515361 RepID=UPI003F80E280